VKATQAQDKISFTKVDAKTGAIRRYEYIENVPLNDAKNTCRVNVMCFEETVKGKTTHWMWVTDLALNLKSA
jgi:ASC-1-like (ASCH) protein